MTIWAPVIITIPINKYSYCSYSNISTNNNEPNKSPLANKRVIFAPGFFVHDLRVSRVEGQSSGWESISHQIHPQQLNRVEAVWNSQNGGQKYTDYFSYVWWNHVSDKSLHVCVDGSALSDCSDYGVEVVIREDHDWSLFGDFSSCNAHCNSNVGLLQGRGVVHSVPSHCHYQIQLNQSLYQLSLVRRLSPRKHQSTVYLQNLQLLFLLQLEKFIACKRILIHFLYYSHFQCYLLSCFFHVSCYHYHIYSG